jgi:hypothetical protein
VIASDPQIAAVRRAITHRTVHNTLMDPPAIRGRAGVAVFA